MVIGLLGIITPGLPTTPFLLFTSIMYARSSPKLYQKLYENKITGAYLRRLDAGLGIKTRLFSISLMWCMVSITAFVVFEFGTMRFVMIGLGIIGTFAQLVVLSKKKHSVSVAKATENSEK